MKTTKKALLAAVALSGIEAFSAGFGFYEMDAASTAFGGHVFGQPLNASAVYYNPAAMSTLTGTVVTLDFTAVNPRADARVDKKHDTRMNSGWICAPTFFITQELPWGFHFGFGGFADFGIASAYNNHWELKYDSTETSFEGYTLQPVPSYEIIDDQWSFAAGPRFTYCSFETKMKRDFKFVDNMYMAQSHGYLHAPVSGKNRLRIHADNEDDIGIGLAAATQFRVTDDFALGVMYRSRMKTELEGRSSWRGSDLRHGNDAKEKIQLPAQVTLGFNWDNALWVEGLHLGSSVSWIEWSKMSAIRFDVYNPVSGEVEKNSIKMDWRNTYRAGFGIGYDLTKNWTVLGGYTYDWDPCRNKIGYAHTMLPLGDRHIASTGLTWKTDDGKWEISVAYAMIILESKTQKIKDEYYDYNKTVHKMHTHNAYTSLVSAGVTYHF